MGIFPQIPYEVVLQVFKYLHSFADLNALVRTSSRFNQIWLQNISPITNALIPRITNYLDLAEDLSVLRALARDRHFGYRTFQKNYLTEFLEFAAKQRALITGHCDVIDETPTEDIIRDIDNVIQLAQFALDTVSPRLLALEESMIVEKKSLADTWLLFHAQGLLRIEKQMRANCDIVRHEVINCLPDHPKSLTITETDCFMKAAYKVTILLASNSVGDRYPAQAIKAAILAHVDSKEETKLQYICNWFLFVRYSNSEKGITQAVNSRRREIFFKPAHEPKYRSLRTAGNVDAPRYFYTKKLISSIVDDEWKVVMNAESDNEDKEEVDDDEIEEENQDDEDEGYDDKNDEEEDDSSDEASPEESLEDDDFHGNFKQEVKEQGLRLDEMKKGEEGGNHNIGTKVEENTDGEGPGIMISNGANTDNKDDS
jgi:hypothetical protein